MKVDQLGMLLKDIIMDKDKLIMGLFWLSLSGLVILLDASLFYIGFNNLKYGSYLIIIIAFIFVPLVFFCCYKGIRGILDAIFF